MMSIPSPAVSRTVRTRSTLRCIPSAPSTGPHPTRSFIAREALVFVLLRFRRELLERLAVEPAGVHRNPRLRSTAEQAEHRLTGGLAENVPQRDVHRADRSHANALAPERHRPAVHVLPQEFDVPRIGADQQRLEIQIDRLLRHTGRERRVADPDVAGVGEDLDDQPAVETEAGHRIGSSRGGGPFGELEDVDRVRAEVRLRRHGGAAPFDDARTDVGDFHAKLRRYARARVRPCASSSGWISGVVSRITTNAITWKVPTMAKTGP